MKICHLIYDDLGNPWLSGGGAVRAREIYRRLTDRHEITFITGMFPQAERDGWVDGMRFCRVGSATSYRRSRLSYCREAIAALAQLQCDVWVYEFSAFAPTRSEDGDLWLAYVITHVDRVSLRPEYLRERAEDYHYNTRVHFTTANLIPAQVYYKAQKLRTMVRQQVLDLLEEVDVLIQPTSGAPANVINLDQKVDSQEHARKALSAGGFRGPYSLSGAPALSILCGFTSEGDGGLPLAIQIAGRPFEEATVLRVAHAYEQASGWNKRVPPAAL